MIRKRFEAVTDWLKTQTDNLECNERRYKLKGAEAVHDRLLHMGTATGKVNVQADDLNLLSWRIVDPLNVMANAQSQTFQAALTALWAQPLAPANADTFWSLLDPALDVLDPERHKPFNGVGTRASVASSFLFIADPEHQPFDRPHFGGRAVNWLYDPREALTTRSPRCSLNRSKTPVKGFKAVLIVIYVGGSGLIRDQWRSSYFRSDTELCPVHGQ